MSKSSIAKFYLDTPLYTDLIFNDKSDAYDIVNDLFQPPFDGYNPVKKCDTTYELCETDASLPDKVAIFNIHLKCKRTEMLFEFLIKWDPKKISLTKIGQFPSVADFHLDQVKQYDKLLNKEKLREFTKAIGLAAAGVGIGSFVYLRRIFEDLINEAYDEYNKKHGDIIDFNKKRMAEKIDSLRDFLPEFLVENKELYGILSKGIHELEEKDCLAHFDAVKVGIEMILDEKLEQLNKKKKAEAARLKIQQASSAITKPEVKP